MRVVFKQILNYNVYISPCAETRFRRSVVFCFLCMYFWKPKCPPSAHEQSINTFSFSALGGHTHIKGGHQTRPRRKPHTTSTFSFHFPCFYPFRFVGVYVIGSHTRTRKHTQTNTCSPENLPDANHSPLTFSAPMV